VEFFHETHVFTNIWHFCSINISLKMIKIFIFTLITALASLTNLWNHSHCNNSVAALCTFPWHCYKYRKTNKIPRKQKHDEKFPVNCKWCEKWQAIFSHTSRYLQAVICWWARQYEDVYNIIINYDFLNAAKPQSQSKVQCQSENKHRPKQKLPTKIHFECNSQLIMLNYIHIKRSFGKPKKKPEQWPLKRWTKL